MSLEETRNEALYYVDNLTDSYLNTVVPWNGHLWGDLVADWHHGGWGFQTIMQNFMAGDPFPENFIWYTFYDVPVTMTFDDMKALLKAYSDFVRAVRAAKSYNYHQILAMTSEEDIINFNIWDAYPNSWIDDVQGIEYI